MSAQPRIADKYRHYWSEAEGCFMIPEGACPSRTGNDDGSALICVWNGNCGCDEQENYPRDPSLPPRARHGGD